VPAWVAPAVPVAPVRGPAVLALAVVRVAAAAVVGAANAAAPSG